MVQAEARRFALHNAGQLLMVMAQQGITEEDLAERLGVSIRTLRFHLRGQNWKGYLPTAAICLSLGVRMETKLTPI
jgi:transcriptional regulator with XRE-family HTH domain